MQKPFPVCRPPALVPAGFFVARLLFLFLFLFLSCPGLAGQEAGKAKPQEGSRLLEAGQILEAADQVMVEVEELRGWKFKEPVKKAVRSEAQLREYLRQKLEEEYGGGRMERTEAWLQAMGLLPKGKGFGKTIMDVLMSQVGGFYEPSEGAFYMMAEASRNGETVGRMLMAHELCHALDDQYVDLAKLTKAGQPGALTEDESFAIGSMVEGSATALMTAWLMRAARRGEFDREEMAAIAKKEQESAEAMIAAPPYFSLLLANYIVGNAFVLKGKTMGQAMASGSGKGGKPDTGAAILEAARNPPRSTEQVLHPDKYWQAEKQDEPVRLVDEDALVQKLEATFDLEVVHRDTLGEMLCCLLGQKKDRRLKPQLAASPHYWTSKAATGWGGDRLFLMAPRGQDGEPELARSSVLWITVWDEEKDRGEFVHAIKKHRAKDPGFCLVEDRRLAIFGFGGLETAESQLTRVKAWLKFEKAGHPFKP